MSLYASSLRVGLLALQKTMLYSSIMLMVNRKQAWMETSRASTRNTGFTIVELMIATMVFSVIMLVAAGAVVRFTSNFQRGITYSTTQNTTRSIIETIAESVQFYGNSGIKGEKGVFYCVGSTSYRYIIGKQLNESQKHILVENKKGLPLGCDGDTQSLQSSPPKPDAQELLAPNMRLVKFDIEEQSNGLVKITVKIAYGDNDLLCSVNMPGNCNDQNLSEANFSNPPAGMLEGLQCKGQKGSQYCAVSEITTTVKNRV